MLASDILRSFSISQEGAGDNLELLTVILITPVLLMPGFMPTLSIVCSILLISVWLIRRIKQQVPFTLNSPLSTIWQLIGIFTIIAVLVSADSAETYADLGTFLLGFAWWRAIGQSATTDIKTKTLVIVFFLVAVGITAIGALSTTWPTTVPFLAPLVELLSYDQLRLPDATSNVAISPNSVAATLILFLPLVLSLLLVNRRGLGKWSVALTAIMVFGHIILLLTQSRGGWIAILFAIWLLIGLIAVTESALTKRNAYVVTFSVSTFILTTIAFWLGPDFFATLWEAPPDSTVVGTFSTINFRREVWEWALVAINDFPLTGTGFGTFRKVAHRLYPIDIVATYDIGHAHNQLMQVALDIGVIGLIAYCALVGTSCWMCIEISRHDEHYRGLGLGIITSLLGFHVWGIGDALMLGAKPMLLFWMATGLTTGIYKQVLESRRL